ncbi:hypothetical protein [Ktedonospora formicarum]|uniref:Uncharacterized protein n=1 Tax=Ktedonospora formicarum TaxID=2778364 RepID=A0A8J3I9E6_9CHLR|nr:hypothetical protein [Ktedonospora formicarum]GHO49861.1 hypothetical protein KSX_80240 [Ktedonospora formicarum]
MLFISLVVSYLGGLKNQSTAAIGARCFTPAIRSSRYIPNNVFYIQERIRNREKRQCGKPSEDLDDEDDDWGGEEGDD